MALGYLGVWRYDPNETSILQALQNLVLAFYRKRKISRLTAEQANWYSPLQPPKKSFALQQNEKITCVWSENSIYALGCRCCGHCHRGHCGQTVKHHWSFLEGEGEGKEPLSLA